ncbi:MAG: glycosyltransferase family 4 protein [Acidimicrobiia bacterium]
MKVCFLSVEPIHDQPRIRRQGDALHTAGYEVVAIGSTGGRSPEPAWRVVELDLPRLSGGDRLLATARQASSALGERAALAAYWSDARRRAVRDAAIAERADVYVAREWRTLPIAVAACEVTGAGLAMDSPELSAEESEESAVWRRFFRPMVVAIERRYLPQAQLVTAVTGRIGDILQQRYALAARPTPVRNMPPYEEHPLRPVGEIVSVLYLGGLLPGRGIEQVIESVSRWPANWRLTLQGPGGDEYVASLRRLAVPVSERVDIPGAVPLTEMVSIAARSDIGIFAHQPNGRQASLALPNKLFEYMMAGLAVCVSDMPSMREVVEEAGAGVLIPAPYGVSEIASAIEQLEASDIVAFKRAALAAARHLNWEHESQGYVAAFSAAFGPPEPTSAR